MAGGAVGAAAAAAAIAQAIKASGAIVQVEPEPFTRLLAANAQGLVVHAPSAFSRHKYIMGYRGLVFWTKTREPLYVPSTVQVVEAKKIWVP
jgi:hypothetical protein